ncbi:MAG: hypothetical protein GY810_25045 [Aureispira sp.]|nr:hypothetical protein [Aureispira sp.]
MNSKKKSRFKRLTMMRVGISILFCLCFCNLNAQELPKLAKEAAIADLETLIKTIEEVHYNPYWDIPKEDFSKKKDSLIGIWGHSDSISLKQFILTGMELTALINDGHTTLDWQNPQLFPALINYKFLPFKAKLIDGKLCVTGSLDDRVPQGIEVLSINGLNAQQLYADVMATKGGLTSFKNEMCESFFPIYLFLRSIKAPYLVQLKGQGTVILERGLSLNEWTPLIENKELKSNYSFKILDEDIAYIAYNSCQDYEAFQAFLTETFQTIKDKKLDKLIVDIRNNGGGNSMLNDLLLPYFTRKRYRQSSERHWKVSATMKDRISDSLYIKVFGKEFIAKYKQAEDGIVIKEKDAKLTKPKKPKNYFKGKACMLIGPQTFSSANFLADAVATYNLATLIGQATGEATNDFGEQIEFQLPNSGTYYFTTVAYDIGADGKVEKHDPIYPDIELHKDVLEGAKQWLRR